MTAVYLKTVIPALVTYVLAHSNWEAEVNPASILLIPADNWTDEDETSLSMRIVRAGGAVVDLSRGVAAPESAETVVRGEWNEFEGKKKYQFGWPKSGGVWVLDLPEWMQRDPFDWSLEQTGCLKRFDNGTLNYDPLKNNHSMEDLCLALKDLGAKFYEDVKASDEVKELGLLEDETCLRKKT